ncbi:hypothetical protein SHI21_15720 [Bacteriovorax sp. PP10]|uniref:Uncharacterized protein n=1 Tax=Bacteriovorax antarcticus TaxID=3088717 RepID=A0ABU5VX96_9BACT|nr:hypothetical protein [Bacteriovorax sp. PP10]MEA9357678.1 hypothetical protein [Bacteriovorax sp. PP10]
MQKIEKTGPVFRALAVILALILLFFSVKVFAINHELQGNFIEQFYVSK